MPPFTPRPILEYLTSEVLELVDALSSAFSLSPSVSYVFQDGNTRQCVDGSLVIWGEGNLGAWHGTLATTIATTVGCAIDEEIVFPRNVEDLTLTSLYSGD